MQAYAVAITEANLRNAIRSEAGRNYDLDWSLHWLEEHGSGWFLRDEGSPLDCQFFMPEVFAELYGFISDDETATFRRVIKL